MNVPFFKMASADLTNFPLVEHTCRKGRPVILSTGMSDMATVRKAVAHALKFTTADKLVLLQCTSTYPSKAETTHLNVMETYRREFPDIVIGYSGHESGLQISLAAAALGAAVVERHFTLDRTWKGGDHAASLEVGGLTRLIRDIRVIEKALGGFEKTVQPGEDACFLKLAKSVVSAVDLVPGVPITREMLTTKGPGRGISPMYLEQLIGKTVAKAIAADSILVKEDIVGFEPSD